MSDSTLPYHIIVVDDRADRLANVMEAAAKLNLVPACMQIDSVETYRQAADQLASLPMDAVIILDLHLNREADRWGPVVANLQTFAARWDWLSVQGDSLRVDTPVGAMTADKILLDGVSLLEPILQNAPERRILVIVASNLGGLPGVREVLSRLNEFAIREGRRWRFEIEIGGRSIVQVATATGILKAVPERWAFHFPDLSDDALIAAVLADYLLPVRIPIIEAWHHDWCAETVGLEFGNRIAGSGLGPNRGDSIESNKALHMREHGLVQFHRELLSNDLESAAFRAILDRLEIPAEVPDHIAYFKLPIMPGIAFLLALRLFLKELAKEAPAAGVEFWRRGRVFGVTVRLQAERSTGRAGSAEYEHLRGFITKVKARGNEGEPKEGLSRAIWSLGHCRVDGLRNIERDKWVDMFSAGAGRWAAWPSFVKEGIEFGW